jgi:hypothetical protein
MPGRISVRGACAALLVASALVPRAAGAQQPTQACTASALPLERQLRQLYLDLLGRPPTIDEYRSQRDKGVIAEEDIDALMTRDEFYARMENYHRALLRANVAASIPNNSDMRMSMGGDGAKPLGARNNTSGALRGRTTMGCDYYIPHDQCQDPAFAQDPHAEGPAEAKVCRDANGVPLPVSFDYDLGLYTCTALDGASNCNEAVSQGLIPEKHLLFCDMRRSAGKLVPFRCLPDQEKPNTAALSSEVLDGAGHVIAFASPTPDPDAQFDRLDRCGLALGYKDGVVGSYQPQRGCIQREGWVMADAPYWDDSGKSQVAACAIEAQAREVNPVTLASCESPRFFYDRSCGCGKNFRRCESGDLTVFEARIRAMNREPLLIADAVLRNDEDYFRILTSRRSFINGVLSSLYRDRQAIGVLAITPPAPRSALPELPYSADPDGWVEYVRSDHAAGVLTTPAFLYRFPTARARVAEFYEAFLCKTFTPPAGAVSPDPEDPCNRENDLAKRCGCNYCHATIEPAGAHWGRFGERSAQYLDPITFPKFDPKCRDCALAGNTNCDGECSNYVMQAYDGDGASSLGMLKTYLYRTEADEPSVAGGPAALVQRMAATGELERCVVTRMWNELLGRPMLAEEQRLYMDALTQGFIDEGRNLKRLIRQIVSSDAYRRVD